MYNFFNGFPRELPPQAPAQRTCKECGKDFARPPRMALARYLASTYCPGGICSQRARRRAAVVRNGRPEGNTIRGVEIMEQLETDGEDESQRLYRVKCACGRKFNARNDELFRGEDGVFNPDRTERRPTWMRGKGEPENLCRLACPVCVNPPKPDEPPNKWRVARRGCYRVDGMWFYFAGSAEMDKCAPTFGELLKAVKRGVHVAA